jgi:hypothetical protein
MNITWDKEIQNYVLKVEPDPVSVVVRQVTRALADDREQKIRQALISLGWTPPHDPQS